MIQIFNNFIKKIGIGSSYLNLILILLICVDVILRYLFSFSQTWIIELEWYLFSLIFLLGIAYTLQNDGHVRVDVFYLRWPTKVKKSINLLGHVFLLIPWCIVGINKSYVTFINSWHFREGSPDPGGLPARYVIKGFIVVCFVLLLIQGIIEIIQIFTNKSTEE